jgi:mRNA interferase RelE/StbE
VINLIWQKFDQDAAKDLRKIGKPTAALILKYLRTRIATNEDPRRFGKPLVGDLEGLWRYRVGDYRIVARIEEDRFVFLSSRSPTRSIRLTLQ